MFYFDFFCPNTLQLFFQLQLFFNSHQNCIFFYFSNGYANFSQQVSKILVLLFVVLYSYIITVCSKIQAICKGIFYVSMVCLERSIFHSHFIKITVLIFNKLPMLIYGIAYMIEMESDLFISNRVSPF